MYKVVSYYDSRGHCEIQDWLDDLNSRAAKGDKDSRIQLKDIMFCFRLFRENGTRMGKYCARVEGTDGLWEFRPGFNRIFFAFIVADKAILLHHYRKKSQKTPPKEIEQALRNLEDYRKRSEARQ